MHTRRVNPQITPHFYDATRETEQEPIVVAPVTWLGFPRQVCQKILKRAWFDADHHLSLSQVALEHPIDRRRWTVADSNREVQDEYLEWYA